MTRGTELDFCIVDQTTPAGQAKAGWSLANGVGAQIAAAMMVQANRDCCPYWGGQVRVRMSTGTGDAPLPTEIACVLIDDMSLVDPGADAFHTETGNGWPTITVGAAQCSSAMVGPDAASVSFSHEILETIADGSLNALRYDGSAYEWHQEIADEVQADAYVVQLEGGPAVSASNFVLPAFYNSLLTVGPFDFMGLVTAPFTLRPGGYITRRPTSGPSADVEIFGKLSPTAALKLKSGLSRLAKRGARLP